MKLKSSCENMPFVLEAVAVVDDVVLDDLNSDDIVAVDVDVEVDTMILVTNPSENCPDIKTTSTNTIQYEYE